MGFLGIQEVAGQPRVPGTVFLDDEASASLSDIHFIASLKRGVGKNSHIVLAPQPSEDPNDPLNWPRSSKLVCFFVIIFGCVMNAAVISSLLNPGLVQIAKDLDVSLSKVALLSGYQYLVAGASGPFICASSRKWGKRPVFIFSSTMGLIGSVIGSAANTYHGVLAARVVQAFATAAYEAVTISMVGDLFFVHERGVYTAIAQFTLGSVANFSAVIAGRVVADLGWKFLFYLCVLFIGVQLILLLLFVPETAYRRDFRLELDQSGSLAATVEATLHEKTQLSKHADTHPRELVVMAPSPSLPPAIPRKRFLQRMQIFTGTYSDENLFQLVLAPFLVCTNLAVLWVVLATGYIVMTYVAQSYVLAQTFTASPYFLSAAGVGYLSLGPFIGGLLAGTFLALASDPIIKFCCKKNHGIYEPEYRLLLSLLGVLSGGALILWGFLCHSGTSFYVTAMVHGIALFGNLCFNIPVSTYALDAYRDMSNEIFIMAMVVKNFLFYSLSTFITRWTDDSGIEHVFTVIGSIALGLMATIPVVFLFGKHNRSFWDKRNVLRMVGIAAHGE